MFVNVFFEQLAVLRALEKAQRDGLFRDVPVLQKAASRVAKRLGASGKSVGRRRRVLDTLAKQAMSVDQMSRKLGVSRRTIFRDLNVVHAADVGLSLQDGKYHVAKPEVRQLLG
jgi:hypothetical protein